jgi:hypothetical protein
LKTTNRWIHGTEDFLHVTFKSRDAQKTVDDFATISGGTLTGRVRPCASSCINAHSTQKTLTFTKDANKLEILIPFDPPSAYTENIQDYKEGTTFELLLFGLTFKDQTFVEVDVKLTRSGKTKDEITAAKLVTSYLATGPGSFFLLCIVVVSVNFGRCLLPNFGLVFVFRHNPGNSYI